jgi:hypothetical protein
MCFAASRILNKFGLMNKIIAAAFIIVFTLASCKKNPFDYRTKYIGDYHFYISTSSYTMGSGTTNSSFETEGRIEYGDSGEIKVIYDRNKPSSFESLEIDRDGSVVALGSHAKIGTADRKSIQYTQSFNGLGGGTTQTVYGKKEK